MKKEHKIMVEEFHLNLYKQWGLKVIYYRYMYPFLFGILAAEYCYGWQGHHLK